MEELINLLTNNGIGIVCVAYLIYFQSTTMKQILTTLENINNRLMSIEFKLQTRKLNEKKEEESNEIKQRGTKSKS